MSTIFSKPSKSIKDAAERIYSNDSTARKFLSTNTVENIEPGAGTSNLEFLIKNAASLKASALASVEAAALASEELSSVREILASDPNGTTSDEREGLRSFSESDVSLANGRLAENITNSIDGLTDLGLSYVNSSIHGLVDSALSSFLPVVSRGDADSSQNHAVPEIDHIVVDLDKRKGTVDAFFTELTYSIPKKMLANNEIKLVRIFRASVTNPSLLRRVNYLSFNGLERLLANGSSRSKNDDSVGQYEAILSQLGVVNAASYLNPIDAETNLRTSSDEMSEDMVNPESSLQVMNDGVITDISSYINTPEEFSQIDRSVALDLNSLRNIRIQNSSLIPTIDVSSIMVGRDTIMDPEGVGTAQSIELRNRQSTTTDVIVDPNNKQFFQEIASFSPDIEKGEIFGDLITFKYTDSSVFYGRTYRYYITVVDKNMREGVRSKIVEATTDGYRIPACPKKVTPTIVSNFVALSITVEDQLVERFEVYRRESDIGYASDTNGSINIVNGPGGFTFESIERNRLRNGFIQLGEIVSGLKGTGATFYDRTVIPGMKYIYRVYSVDVFGNKSECPAEVEFYVPNRENKLVDLRQPTIIAENMSGGTGFVKVTFRCEDPRVKHLFLTRRDLSLFQEAFTYPSSPNHIKLDSSRIDKYSVTGTFISTNGKTTGSFSTQRSAQGNIRNNDLILSDINASAGWVGWNGIFSNTQEDITFIDKSTRIDHTYQYRIYGVDKFGNFTPFAYTWYVFVYNQPVIDAPVELTAKVNPDLTGVMLTWLDGAMNYSPEELLGSQEALTDSAVRSLYQIQRRRVGEDRWLDFPLIAGTSFFDDIATQDTPYPEFRPPYLEVGQTYLYRVSTYQTGGFVSNFTKPIELFVDRPVLAPINFRCIPSDPKIRPFYNTLSWDTPDFSGIVDRWDIERAEVNNYAADRMNIDNPEDFLNLSYESFRSVYRESSRFKSRTLDEQGYEDDFPGNHAFIDMKVTFGNTYFYRIRAVGIDGSTSEWSYRGAKVTDETFEKQFESIVNQEEINEMVNSYEPMNFKSEWLSPAWYDQENSFSIVASFANPSTIVEPSSEDFQVEPTVEEVMFNIFEREFDE